MSDEDFKLLLLFVEQLGLFDMQSHKETGASSISPLVARNKVGQLPLVGPANAPNEKVVRTSSQQ